VRGPGQCRHKDAAFPPTQARRGFDRDSESIPHQPQAASKGSSPPSGTQGCCRARLDNGSELGEGSPLEALIGLGPLAQAFRSGSSALRPSVLASPVQDLALAVILLVPFLSKVIALEGGACSLLSHFVFRLWPDRHRQEKAGKE